MLNFGHEDLRRVSARTRYPDHIELAEQLGYETAFVYDTPALQLDVWMTLALAAARTDRIRLGPGVLIPSLRHPMVTAAAIATLVGLVGPDRVVVGAGTGFTGRRAIGQKPLKWAEFPALSPTCRPCCGVRPSRSTAS